MKFKILYKNSFRFTFLLFFFLFGEAVLYAQNSTCINADFELGTFDGWEGELGSCCPIYTSPSGIVFGNHTIMTGTDTDPNTCNVVTVVAPGGTYSARLGNQDGGAQSEKLRYVLSVTPTTSLFIYKYAVVLEDPGHEEDEQPRFDVRVVDDQGNFIDPDCGGYTVVAGSNIPGFQTCNGSIRYKDWTTVGLNLTPYMGQNITIEFMTGDCSLGGHFGYAYIDAYCSSLQISTAYCIGSSAAQLTAPIGFEYLWSTGATTQSILINNAQQGDVYDCVLTSVTGCQVTVSATIALDDPIADFALNNTCYDNAEFNNTSQTFSSIFNIFSWDFGDGTQSTDENPIHIFPSPGNYTVSLTISNSLGCTRSITKTITVYPTPTASISYASDIFCLLSTNSQSVLLTGTGSYTGGVFSSSAGLSLDPLTGAIHPSLSQPGTYQVTYTIPTLNNCTVPPLVTTVTIVGSPTASIHYLSIVFCQNSFAQPQSVVLTGFGAYTNGTFSSIPSGLSINPTSGTIDVNNSLAGTYTVNYTIVSSNECPDFVDATTVTILASPLPSTVLSDGAICMDATGQIVSSYTFTTGLNNASYDFQWFFENNSIIGATFSTYTATQPGNYYVLVTNTLTGCISQSGNATVSIIAVATDITISIEEEFHDSDVTIQVINGIGSYLYQLDTNPSQTTNVFYDVSAGMHTIKVTDIANCTYIIKDFFVLSYPKYFTPNGDGSNDFWKIDSNNVIATRVSIYDRFGKLLYTMNDNDRGWDGTYLGTKLPSSDYWFIVDYQYKNTASELKSFKAHFSLKR